MPTTSYLSPGTVTGNVGNPGNIQESDDVRTSTNTNGAVQATNFGFAIPSGATIDGVEVGVEFRVTGGTWNVTAQLYNASAVIGSSKTGANTSSTTDITQTFGGASDLWGATLTRDIVNGSGYGVDVLATRVSGAGGARLQMDHVQMRITYTEAGGGGGNTVYVKVAGTFVEASVQTKVAGTFVPSTITKL
jgi:hypothetical protein